MIPGAVHVLRRLAAPVIAGLTCMKYAIIAPHIRSSFGKACNKHPINSQPPGRPSTFCFRRQDVWQVLRGQQIPFCRKLPKTDAKRTQPSPMQSQRH